MPLTVYSASYNTVPDLVEAMDDLLAPAVARTIVGAGFLGIDQVRAPGIEMSVYAILDSGGVSATTPFQVTVFTGTSLADAASQVNAFMLANAGYFFSPAIFAKLDTVRHTQRDVALLFYNTNYTDGINNWVPLGSTGAAGGGTVTSVGLTLPVSVFSVAGSPVTSSGTITATLVNQSPNTVFCGPASGGAAAPTFRALVSDDIPGLAASKITSGIFAVNRGGTGVDASAAANGALLIGTGAGFALGTLTGTANRLSVVNASGSITLNIDTAYVGQASITTVGTIGTGVWQGTAVAAQFGGTGVNGSAAASGQLLIGNGTGYSLNTLTGTANRLSVANAPGIITLNIDAAYVGQASITTLGTVGTGTWQGTAVAPQYGGTGLNGAAAANGTLLIGNSTGYTLNTLTAGSGVSILNTAGNITISATGSGGSVTSVGLSLGGGLFTVSGTPVTTTGTLTGTLANQTANLVFAGPSVAGPAAQPTFRALVNADLAVNIVAGTNIQNSAVSFAKIQDIPNNSLMGRFSAGPGAPESVTVGTNLTLTGGGSLDHSDSALAATTISFPSSLTTDNRGHVIAATENAFYNGEGLVIGRCFPGRSITSLTGMFSAPELGNRVFLTTAAATGILYEVDPITKEVFVLGSYAGKSFTGGVYEPFSNRIYLNHGTNNISVDPDTGTIINSGIGPADIRLGWAIRPSSGGIYGGNNAGTFLSHIQSGSDTVLATITLSITLSGSSRKAVTYCNANDSVYAIGGPNISRVSCVSNLEVATFSPAGISTATLACTIAYSETSHKVYAAGNTCLNLVQIDPDFDTQEASYPFPPGCAGTGCSGMVVVGRYLYLGVNAATTPSEILVFDTQDNVFVASFNSLSGGLTNGAVMTGIQGATQEDSFLFTLLSTSGGWTLFGGLL